MNSNEAPFPRSGLLSNGLPILTLEKSDLLDVESALKREWLLTNGIGGYASGTVLSIDTRRYHGLLIGAAAPPIGRTLLLSRVHESLSVQQGEDNYSLHSIEYHDGTVHPVGHIFIQQFQLHGTLPVWHYRCRDVEIEKAIWFEHSRNTVFLRYRLLTCDNPVRLRLEPFTTCRGYHSHTRGDPNWHFDVLVRGDRCRVEAFPGATPLWLRVVGGSFVETGMWYWRILHRRERDRGYHDHIEDSYTPGVFGMDLLQDRSVTLIATTQPEDLDLDPEASLQRELSRQERLIELANATESPENYQRLILAADQFVGMRDTSGRTIFAGFHWFDERSRDAMISVPGICLVTGREKEGRAVITTFVDHLHLGLLPHSFPSGKQPDYDTIDSSLWLFETVARYERSTNDRTLVDDILSRLEDVVSWYERGTLHGIEVDLEDGLVRSLAPGLHLTWMDAQFWEWVVTPRQGKPVEVQALWYNALRLLADWKAERRQDASHIISIAERCHTNFNRRFWDQSRSYCFDVIDGPGGSDPSLRPNQLLAFSLTHPILDPARWDAVLTAIDEELLTPFGLRTLAPSDPKYRGTYAGDQTSRDNAYHQGTVWPWLLGAYINAARKVRGDQWDYMPLLRPLVEYSSRELLGQPAEVFDGDPPYTGGGCIARAWNVAEILRCWPKPSGS